MSHLGARAGRARLLCCGRKPSAEAGVGTEEASCLGLGLGLGLGLALTLTLALARTRALASPSPSPSLSPNLQRVDGDDAVEGGGG